MHLQVESESHGDYAIRSMKQERAVSELITPSSIWMGSSLKTIKTLGKSGGRSEQAKAQPSLDLNIK